MGDCVKQMDTNWGLMETLITGLAQYVKRIIISGLINQQLCDHV